MRLPRLRSHTTRAALASLVFAAALFLWGALPRLDGVPAFGTLLFALSPDATPIAVQVQAGGDVAASALQLHPDCRGYIQGAAPTVRLNLTQPGAHDLTIQLEADARSSLVVNGSDGRWYCASAGKDTTVTLARPNSGQLDIWAGAFTELPHDATLTIATRPSAPR